MSKVGFFVLCVFVLLLLFGWGVGWVEDGRY